MRSLYVAPDMFEALDKLEVITRSTSNLKGDYRGAAASSNLRKTLQINVSHPLEPSHDTPISPFLAFSANLLLDRSLLRGKCHFCLRPHCSRLPPGNNSRQSRPQRWPQGLRAIQLIAGHDDQAP